MIELKTNNKFDRKKILPTSVPFILRTINTNFSIFDRQSQKCYPTPDTERDRLPIETTWDYGIPGDLTTREME